MTSQELINHYAWHLAQLKWQLCGSLSFRRQSVPFWMAKRCFVAWISQIDVAEGKDTVQWARIYHSGAFPDDPGFHVLLADVKAESKYVWINLWQEIAGDADIEYAVCHHNASRFLSGIARHGSDFEIDHYLI